ncbi:MAG: hypothetical protein QM817_32245 [Archangium sp.]
MAIDGIKSGSPVIAQQPASASVEVQQPKPPAPPPPPPPPPPTEAFDDAKKKPLSITGKFSPPPTVGSNRSDLKELVANQRLMAFGGLVGNNTTASAPLETSDVREAMNAKPPNLEVVRKGVSAGLLDDQSPHMKGIALEQLRASGTDADKEAMVDLVKSCKSKVELRDVVANATKKGDPHGYTPGQADFHKYDKLMTDEHPFLIADWLNPDSKTLPDNLSKPGDPNSISNRFHIEDTTKVPAQRLDEKVSLDPNDVAARRKFIDHTTQTDAARQDPAAHGNGCAPTAVVVSCLQQSDPKAALTKLCEHNLKLSPDDESMKALKAKLDGGKPITRDDINKLQDSTYAAMQKTESSMGGGANKTVSLGAVKKFMADSGVGYSGGVPALVDNDGARDKYGNQSAEHYVLINERKGEVFDPWPREGAHQLVRRDGMGGGVYDAGAYETYRHSIQESAQPLAPILD